MGAAGNLGDQVEVGRNRLALGDQGALALGEAVAHVVGRVDGRPFGDKPVGDVVVTAGVLAVAVGDQPDERGVGVRPLEEDEVAGGARKGMLGGLGHRARILPGVQVAGSSVSFGDHLLVPGKRLRTWIKYFLFGFTSVGLSCWPKVRPFPPNDPPSFHSFPPSFSQRTSNELPVCVSSSAQMTPYESSSPPVRIGRTATTPAIGPSPPLPWLTQ